MASNRWKLPIIVTTCSAGKRCCRTVHVDELPAGHQDAVAAAWISLVGRKAQLTPARALYAGRAFGLATRAAQLASADLAVISAGLGYVRGDTRIPSYDLTVRPTGPGSVVPHIRGGFDARRWWQSILNGPFSADIAADLAGRPLALVCLSRAYAAMVADDLVAYASRHSTGLRIFGLSIAAALPNELRPFVLPYDERLEGAGTPGTRVDFPQRALLDYVTHVLPTSEGELARDIEAVSTRLSAFDRPRRDRAQRRVDDATVKALIARALPTVGPSRSRVLAHLRHVDGVSVEQRRFADLFRAVRADTAP